MNSFYRTSASLPRVVLLTALAGLHSAVLAASKAELARLPDGGIQPQAAVGADGAVHLVYFRGEAAAGDLYYVRWSAPGSFSQPLRVNTHPKSAIAAGTIRGAQLALGRDDRPHVVWNGSSKAQPRGPQMETPLLYTRLSDSADAFEPERNVIQQQYGLDGGGCIAADRSGRVYIAWHAGTGRGEAARRVWLVRSENDGETFSEEQAVDAERVGACGCCGMSATVAPDGEVSLLYRSAREEVHRDMYLLASNDHGATFSSRKLQEWTINACPMSSGTFAHTKTTSWAAWETAEQIHYAPVGQPEPVTPKAMAGNASRRKHPRLAVNQQGDVLLVTTEGTGWNRGGNLRWQLLDAQGRPAAPQGTAQGIPAWSFAAPCALPDGQFVIFY